MDKGKNMTDDAKKFGQAARKVGFKKAVAKVDIRAELSARLGKLPEGIEK